MMKRLLLLMLGLAVASTAGQPARAQEEDHASPKLRIAWEEFKKLYDDGKVVVVDVRGADAYGAGHIPGSRSIPLPDVERHAPELKKLAQPVVLYCA
jgi:3-mercaptopyruvate sulfurtransferase SseA